MGNAPANLLSYSSVTAIADVPPCPRSYPYYVSSAVIRLHREFLSLICSLLLQHGLFYQSRRRDPALIFKKPDDLERFIDVELGDKPMKHVHLVELLRRIVHFAPRFTHPYYMYQLLSGLDPYAIIGDFVASMIPSAMLGYRDAPVYYMMEEEISKKLRELAGYPEGQGDCIFPPGCALANIYSIVLARHSKFPEAKQVGMMHLPKMAIFASQDVHSCFQKGCIYTSVGLDNIYLVKTDPRGKMSIQHLVKCIEDAKQSGKIPLMVYATSGTNVFGAFDPLEDLSRVCKQYDMWLHSDAALGGGVIFSETQRNLRLKGMELCDSFAANFHKLGSASQVSSVLLTPHTNILKQTFGLGYKCEDFSSFEILDPTNDFFHRERDNFEKYVESTRRPDIVKLFFMWKGKGLQGLGDNVNDAYDRAKFLLDELKRRQLHRGKFIPLMEEFESPVIPFYYVPTYLHKLDKSSNEFKERMNMHTSYLLAELVRNGIMVVTTQTLRGSPLFFKMITFNSSLTKEDLTYLLDQIDNYGAYLRVPFETPDLDQREVDPNYN